MFAAADDGGGLFGFAPAGGADQDVFGVGADFETADGAVVGIVEPIGDAQQASEGADHALRIGRQRGVGGVLVAGLGAAVVSRDHGDAFHFFLSPT